MKFKLLIICLFFSSFAMGQEIMLEEETENLYDVATFGANRKHFVHFFLGVGFHLPGEDNAALNYWNTNAFMAGIRYKYKFSNMFSAGLDLHYKKSNFRYDQETQIIQDNQFYEKERMVIHGVGPTCFLRINFDEDRGNYIGNFIDFGFYYDWLPGSQYITNDETGTNFFKEKETVYKNLKQLNSFEYGFSLRMSKNKYMFFLQYRLNDLFDEKYNYTKHPEAVIGLMFGIHN